MGRATYRNVVINTSGGSISGATVTVREPGTNTSISETIYSGTSGAGTQANPITTDSVGEFVIWLAGPKRVDLFIQGTGFTSRTETIDVIPPGDEHIAGWFNVMAYGAKGDGTTNDTAAINSALTAAAGGGVVFFPPGTFLVTGSGSTVFQDKLFNNLTLRGVGRDASTIKVAASSNGKLFDQTGTTANNVTFDQLTFDLNGANQSDGGSRDTRSGFFFLSVTQLTVRDCRITGLRHGAAFRLSKCDDTYFTGNIFDNIGLSSTFQGDCIFARNQTRYRVMGNSFQGATNPDTAVAQDGVDHSVVSGNTIKMMNGGISAANSATEGSSIAASSHDTTITGNSITGQGGASGTSVGIKVSGYGNAGNGQIKDVIINSNTIDNCDRALWIEQADRVTVIGNTVHDAVGANKQLILLSTTGTLAETLILGNRIYNTTNRGISFDAGTITNIDITDNDFQTTTTTIGGTTPTTARVKNNRGHNPKGSVTTPAFPGTTVAVTNTTGYDVTAFVANGTTAITQVALDSVNTGMNIPASSWESIFVPAGQSITFTYASGTPTWVWVGS